MRRLCNEHLVGSYPLMEGIPNIRYDDALIRKVMLVITTAGKPQATWIAIEKKFVTEEDSSLLLKERHF